MAMQNQRVAVQVNQRIDNISEAESDRMGSEEEGERHGSSKFIKPSHEVEHGPFSVWSGAPTKELTHAAGCSESSRCALVGKSAIPEPAD